MVHMLSCSYVHPILEYIKKRWEQQDTDVSLIRHFVFEVKFNTKKRFLFDFCLCFSLKVLEMIGPPYEPSFVQLFLPLLQNEAIAGTISRRTEEERKCVKEFLGKEKETNSQFLFFIILFLSFRSCINNCFITYIIDCLI